MDLSTIILIVGLAGTTVVLLWKLHEIIMRFEKLELRAENYRKDNEQILMALFVVIGGFKQGSNDGVVSKTLEELREYLVKSQ